MFVLSMISAKSHFWQIECTNFKHILALPTYGLNCRGLEYKAVKKWKMEEGQWNTLYAKLTRTLNNHNNHNDLNLSHNFLKVYNNATMMIDRDPKKEVIFYLNISTYNRFQN